MSHQHRVFHLRWTVAALVASTAAWLVLLEVVWAGVAR